MVSARMRNNVYEKVCEYKNGKQIRTKAFGLHHFRLAPKATTITITEKRNQQHNLWLCLCSGQRFPCKCRFQELNRSVNDSIKNSKSNQCVSDSIVI